MKEKITIVLTTDDEFADLCSVTIASIKENCSFKYIYEIYILETRLSNDNIDKLQKMSNNHVIVKCIDITEYVDFNKIYETDNYKFEMYYRYYAPLILSCKKMIYLDCDIIVVQDIAKLYNENLENKTIGMVKDYTYYIDNTKTDFNSGVLLINTELFEKQKIREKCLELIKNNIYKFPDQTALNIVCKNNIKTLKTKYNYQVSLAYYHRFKKNIRKKVYKNLFLEEPEIIHFSYITKPYNNIYSKYNKFFWQYAKYTKYYNVLIEKYLKDPYEVIRNSPIEDIYIDLTEEGQVGLKKIFEVLIYQLKYWLLYKIKKGKRHDGF